MARRARLGPEEMEGTDWGLVDLMERMWNDPVVKEGYRALDEEFEELGRLGAQIDIDAFRRWLKEQENE